MNDKIFKKMEAFGWIGILPIERSYYKLFSFPRKGRIKKDVIRINFSEHSPFGEKGEILFKSFGEKLGIWFSEKLPQTPVVLPESYILFRYLSNRKEEGIFLFETTPQKIIVIKEGTLQRQTAKERFSDLDVTLIKKEFDTDTFHQVDARFYHAVFEKGVRALTLADLYAFHQIEIDVRSSFERIIESVALPVAAGTGILLILQLGYHFFLEKKSEEIANAYRELKQKNMEISDRLHTIERSAEQFAGIRRNLYRTQRYFEVANYLSRLMKEHNATFEMLNFKETRLRMRIESNASDAIFDNMIKSGNFDKLKIHSTQKLRYKKRERVTIEGEILL